MDNKFYDYLALLIAVLVFMASYFFKIITARLEISFIIRDFIVFIIVYVICRLLLKYLTIIIKYYKEMF
ncbi:MAG: hypothetical protein SVN78_03390 [Deferribacterota bacterium]|nr:hypothetical protein [Deferribacterota bacterium]